MVQSRFRAFRANILAFHIYGSKAPPSFRGRALSRNRRRRTMKLITTTALAVVVAAFATPAAAQEYQNSYSQPRQQQPSTQPTSGQSTAQQPAAAVKPSSKAAKAIIDLQTAVNNKDFANVPAKVAAAQAVASTSEDRYLIARLQL